MQCKLSIGSVHDARTLESYPMTLISLLVTLIVVGVLLWLVNNYIPMDSKIKNILNIVVVIAVVIWLLNLLGLTDNLRGIRVGS
ncbi:Thivi_2564 family membrane protein [Synechococcus sp. CS-1333]|uniref:Thivi_2564 family membrane protein n=2 Tax=Synechococcus TaxID=1129 RepID=UPI00223BB5F6|nr:Thivi_2564 family membrane protein [Synechococcus sp. CS-1333]